MVLVGPRASRKRSPRTPEHAKSGLRGPDGLLGGPRGALGGSLETFRELTGSFRSTFCECFSTKKVITCNFQSKRGREVFSTRGNARSASLQTKFEKEAVDNAVDSAHSVCRRVRFTVLRIRFWGRRKWPQASRIYSVHPKEFPLLSIPKPTSFPRRLFRR